MSTLVHGSPHDEEYEHTPHRDHEGPLADDELMPVQDDELMEGAYRDLQERPTSIPAPISTEPVNYDIQALSQAGGAGRLLAGKYKPERVLGESRIAINIRVQHVELGHRFLFIHLHRRVRGHIDAVERFLKGARAALRLQSEHTARTIDAGRLESGVPYVVSEYPPGSSLRRVLHIAGPLPVSEAVEYVLQASEALAEAHARGIVHGHLTPSYLFLSRGPDGAPLIKVLGFGVADALCVTPLEDVGLERDDDDDELSPRNADCVAPEQIRDAADVDELTDVWGLGALLHQLLAAAPVFVASNDRALAAMIAADMPTPITSIRSDVPSGLETVILRCLAKDRFNRFASVSELAVALESYGPPHLAAAVNRIVRTLARSSIPPSLPTPSLPPPLPVNPHALVRVGPSVSPPSSAPPTSRRALSVSSTPSPVLSSLQELNSEKTFAISSRALLALGAVTALVVAGLLGGVLARRQAPAPAATSAAAKPAPAPAPPPTEAVAAAPVTAPPAPTGPAVAPAAAPAGVPQAPQAAAHLQPVLAPTPPVAAIRPVAQRAPRPAPRPAAAGPKAASTLFDDTE